MVVILHHMYLNFYKKLCKALVLVGFCFAIACNRNNSNEAYKKFEAILNTETFAQISDSIDAAPKNGMLYAVRSAIALKNNLPDLAWLDAKNAWKHNKTTIGANAISNVCFGTPHQTEYTGLLQAIVKEHPNELKYRRSLQMAYFNEKKYKEALVQNDSIFTIINGKPVVGIDYFLQDRGKLLLEVKDTGNAIIAFQNALKANPTSDDAAFELANIWSARGDIKTIEICNQIIQADTSKTKSEPYFFKAVYYDNINQPDNAIAQLQIGIKSDWTFIDGWLLLGDINLRKNNIAAAEEAYTKAMTISKKNADAWYGLGQVAEKKGNTQDAILQYSRAISLDNNFIEAKEAIARLEKK
jgi:tetratricopeptide (TPR) repeat protein